MARLTDHDFAALRGELDRDAARALGDVRRTQGDRRTAETDAWLAAGDRLAEKAIAALDTGDDVRAARLVARIVALPVLDEETRPGLLAVHLLLYSEVVQPTFEDAGTRGLLDLPLGLLPTLAEPAAAELRQVLAVMTGSALPANLVRRIAAVVDPERRLDPPFAGVPEAALPAAVAAVLRLVLRLRAAED